MILVRPLFRISSPRLNGSLTPHLGCVEPPIQSLGDGGPVDRVVIKNLVGVKLLGERWVVSQSAMHNVVFVDMQTTVAIIT